MIKRLVFLSVLFTLAIAMPAFAQDGTRVHSPRNNYYYDPCPDYAACTMYIAIQAPVG